MILCKNNLHLLLIESSSISSGGVKYSEDVSSLSVGSVVHVAGFVMKGNSIIPSFFHPIQSFTSEIKKLKYTQGDSKGMVTQYVVYSILYSNATCPLATV